MRSSTDLIVSPEAEDDLRDIYGYTRETWDERQADAYGALVDHAFRRIQTFPQIGRVAADDNPSVREYAVQNHLILYRYDHGTVTILRIVNPRRLRR